jgi:hypothetical protein
MQNHPHINKAIKPNIEPTDAPIITLFFSLPPFYKVFYLGSGSRGGGGNTVLLD